MNSNVRSIECSISMGNIQDQVAALLYATGKVRDNEEIEEIIFEKGLGHTAIQADGTVPITIKIRAPERMDLTES